MARFLIVANQTASSPWLVAKVKELAKEEPDAQFVLLVPATAVRHLLRRRSQHEATTAARQQADEAVQLFAREGVPLAAAKVGAESPIDAIAAELEADPGYEGFVVSTLPTIHSRWTLINLPAKVEATYGLPVHHVEAPPQGLSDWDIG